MEIIIVILIALFEVVTITYLFITNNKRHYTARSRKYQSMLPEMKKPPLPQNYGQGGSMFHPTKKKTYQNKIIGNKG